MLRGALWRLIRGLRQAGGIVDLVFFLRTLYAVVSVVLVAYYALFLNGNNFLRCIKFFLAAFACDNTGALGFLYGREILRAPDLIAFDVQRLF